jgi:L-amino acid N-acyltransferase YncA
MPGSFSSTRFMDVDVSDAFFDSLRNDYPEFNDWFLRKSEDGESALVCTDEEGIGAFVYIKEENEPIQLTEGSIPAFQRLKIGTLKVADRIQGERLGEGAIGLALWRWRESGRRQIYVTVFEKHQALVGILRKFGFRLAGAKNNGESVYLKDRDQLDYADAFTCFPFLNPHFGAANLLAVNDTFHDELFPYSELAREFHDAFTSAAANGVTKMYIGAVGQVATAPGHPILIYRRHTGNVGSPGFKSVVTSYCVVTDVVYIKQRGRSLLTYDEYRNRVKNKSVFSDDRIRAYYTDNDNLALIEMVYLGYFGPGHNVNWKWLNDRGYMGSHPHQLAYTREALAAILKAGGVDIATLIVD